MTNQSREAFVAGEFRSELRIAIPKLNGAGVEWIIAAAQSHLEAALSEGRRQGIEAAAYAIENNTCVRHCDLCRTAPCGKTSAEQIRALIEKRSTGGGGMGPVSAEKAGDAL